MIKKEFLEVTEKRSVIVAAICDNCGKENKGSKQPDDWHSFEGHHNSWGNDSIDSYENYLACSPECYIELLKKAFKNFHEYSTAEINGMKIGFVKKLLEFSDGK